MRSDKYRHRQWDRKFIVYPLHNNTNTVILIAYRYRERKRHTETERVKTSDRQTDIAHTDRQI